ncbi:VOC family protein [Arcicella lustrica]|uniref:VOC family protein n=1 Tax=Arcicella lustrica TaxID=2984196 RepID=A0ABU5SEJ9_9BACT|nr:VOC family protein [Arcicella sp. DC25W]MEA5425698.1 VOC family protein [Arcicella sp. DC25W]
MKQSISQMTLVVQDYDEAIEFYTQKLQFELVEDTPLTESKRWVLLRPQNSNGFCLLLAKAVNEEQKKSVGNQSGGRVFLFLNTDDFWRDFHQMKSVGIEFAREPSEEVYGTVAVFKDLYGNLWDLIENRF